MSYCRWSSDDFDCDLYAYEAQDGYTIHVASRRIVGKVPPLDMMNPDPDVVIAAYVVRGAFMDSAERVPIGLRYDGETFVLDTLEELRETFVMLGELGYHFPAYVLDEIDDEIREEKQENAGIGAFSQVDADGLGWSDDLDDDFSAVHGAN